MKNLAKHPLFWPCTTLLLLIALNAAMNPGFLVIDWRDGHFYGNLIDILNRAAPLALVSAGMTLVIAARGLDISVGAVVAIAAAVAAIVITSHSSACRSPSRPRWACRSSAASGMARWWWAWACSPSSPR